MSRNTLDEEERVLLALQTKEPCGNCGADGAKVPCMSGCREVFYCSRECMMLHASAHRLRCRNLRCSKFNDSDSDMEASSGDEDNVTDSDEGEEWSLDEEEEEERADSEIVKKVKKKKKSKRQSKKLPMRTLSIDSVKELSCDPETERRIEEKILSRLKIQEEIRITMAIEQRMKEEKANWRDDEMNRIMMDMRRKLESEMKNGVSLVSDGDSKVKSPQPQGHYSNAEARSTAHSPKSQATIAAGLCDTPQVLETHGSVVERSAEHSPPDWNNSCPAFKSLRVVVWKHNFMPFLEFMKDRESGIWNKVFQLDTDESFSHVEAGDILVSLNGIEIDSNVRSKNELDAILSSLEKPWTMKFRANNPRSNNVHDYTVAWTNGPLGITLKDDCANNKVPIVNRLTKKVGSVAVKQNIAIGDILIAINNIDTIQLGCSLSMSILKKVQLPARLRFRGVGGSIPKNEAEVVQGMEATISRPPVHKVETTQPSPMPELSRPMEYTVEWGKGPLGLTIIPGLTPHDLPVIKKVTGTGASPGIEHTQIGDLLVSINRESTLSVPFEKIVSNLKSAPKPVKLHFRVATEEDEARQSINFMAQHNKLIENDEFASQREAQTPISSKPSAKSHAYSLVWKSGPLGLTIDTNAEGTVAYIKRIASEGAAANMSKDCLGDILTHINDLDVRCMQFNNVIHTLKTVEHPVRLHFKRSHHAFSMMSTFNSSSISTASNQGRTEINSEACYRVIWKEDSNLGLSLRSADLTSDYPYISKVSGTGSAAHLPSSVVGDYLVSIENSSVHSKHKSFEEVMDVLKRAKKPVTLVFSSRSGTLHRSASSSDLPVKLHSNQSTENVYRKQHSEPAMLASEKEVSPVQSNKKEAVAPRQLFMSSDSSKKMEEEKFNSIHAPFLVQNKLSANRRQRMLKGLKK